MLAILMVTAMLAKGLQIFWKEKNTSLGHQYYDVDSIAIFGILGIQIFRIGKDMVFAPFGKGTF